MSKTSIPEKVALQLWVRAGGRCQYRGCPERLYRDDLTMREVKHGRIAHIVADSEGGPRGDKILSPLLAKTLSNLMLMCNKHHDLIDKDDVSGHPVELLQEMKQQQEERVELLMSQFPQVKSTVLMLGSRIFKQVPPLDLETARQAMWPNTFPDEAAIKVDLRETGLKRSDTTYYSTMRQDIEGRLNDRLPNTTHVSVFAFGSIPLLILLGHGLGEKIPADVYQHHRKTGTWNWPDGTYEPVEYRLNAPRNPDPSMKEIALVLSLSDRVAEKDIKTALPFEHVVYTLSIDHPNVHFLQAKSHLDDFRAAFSQVLTEIKNTHGLDCNIHLITAVPLAVAVEIGRQYRTQHPRMLVYELDNETKTIVPVLTLPN